jgi:hypothetical protein
MQMPKIGDMYPSRYLKAGDFEDGDATLTIADIRQERIGQGRDADDKWIVYFEEEEKGLVLNKTNSNSIAKLHGDDTDDWIGKEITLFATEVQFQSEMVEAIRIRSKPPRRKAAPARPAAKAPARTPARPAPDGDGDGDGEDEDNEDIPF